MIKIENTDMYGWEAAIRGMRNPYESWDKSDSILYENSYLWCDDCPKRWENCSAVLAVSNGCFELGENDLKLMRSLAKAGNDHAKFARMINVTCDITAPLYWWPEYDIYQVGIVVKPCSKMHKIHAKEFTLDDFSHEHLFAHTTLWLNRTIVTLNEYREKFLETKDKKYWWQMVQLLPSSYNQRRTIQLDYRILWFIYQARKNCKIDEWREFCKWIEDLPYFKEIYLGVE